MVPALRLQRKVFSQLPGENVRPSASGNDDLVDVNAAPIEDERRRRAAAQVKTQDFGIGELATAARNIL